MGVSRQSRFYQAALLSFALAGFSTPGFSADAVTSGPAQLVVPSGNDQPRFVAAPESIAAKPTMTAAQMQAARNAPSALVKGLSPAAPLAPPTSNLLSFQGTNQTQGLRPPDTHGAVGASQFVEVTNSTFEVFNKLTGVKTKSVTLNSFCGYTPTTIFDPRVVYDKIWNRWVVTAEAFPESATTQIFCMGISLTSDATGGFYIYRFDAPRGSASNFFDYPELGMDQDAVIVTANIFNSDDSYLFSYLFGIAKADLYNGRGFSVPVFSAGASGTLAPPIVETNDTPTLIMSFAGASALQIRRASNLGRSFASLSGPSNITVAFSAPPDARQSGTTDKLDVLFRFVDHGTQIRNHVLNTTTIGSGSFPIPRWFQVDGNTNTLFSSGFFYQSGPSDDWNPSIAGSPIGGTSSNPIGRMFFTYSSTISGSTNARVMASGRLATDPVSVVGASNFGGSVTFYNPSGDTVERWGDYSSVSLDPTAVGGCPAGNRAYFVNERILGTSTWGTRFGREGFC